MATFTGLYEVKSSGGFLLALKPVCFFSAYLMLGATGFVSYMKATTSDLTARLDNLKLEFESGEIDEEEYGRLRKEARDEKKAQVKKRRDIRRRLSDRH